MLAAARSGTRDADILQEDSADNHGAGNLRGQLSPHLGGHLGGAAHGRSTQFHPGLVRADRRCQAHTLWLAPVLPSPAGGVPRAAALADLRSADVPVMG